RRPPESCWPRGTTGADGGALRTPFASGANGEKEVALTFDQPFPEKNLAFVVHFPKENRWLRNGGSDFAVAIPPPPGSGPSLNEGLDAWAREEGVTRQLLNLDSGDRLAASVRVNPEVVRVRLTCDAESPLVLHWAFMGKLRHEWKLPPDNDRPAGTTV